MANAEKLNGYGVTDSELRRLVERQQKWQTKNERNKVAAKLLKIKIAEAGIVVSESEIDAAIAQGK